MKLDVVEKDLANKNLDGFINDLYYYNVCYFLENGRLSSESNSLIDKCQFNMHKNNFFADCQQYTKKVISNETPYFSNVFLDLQATKEIEKSHPLDMANKRNYKGFMNSTEKFLMENFNYFSSKYYIFFILTYISDTLSSSFEQELNLIVEDLMKTSEIQEKISDCFRRKFEDFSDNIYNYPPFINKQKYDYISNREYNTDGNIYNKKLYEK